MRKARVRLASDDTGRVCPFRQVDEKYRSFLELVARQLSSGIANAYAYEEERRRAEALEHTLSGVELEKLQLAHRNSITTSRSRSTSPTWRVFSPRSTAEECQWSP